jgi:hypothetical protein
MHWHLLIIEHGSPTFQSNIVTLARNRYIYLTRIYNLYVGGFLLLGPRKGFRFEIFSS